MQNNIGTEIFSTCVTRELQDIEKGRQKTWKSTRKFFSVSTRDALRRFMAFPRRKVAPHFVARKRWTMRLSKRVGQKVIALFSDRWHQLRFKPQNPPRVNLIVEARFGKRERKNELSLTIVDYQNEFRVKEGRKKICTLCK